MSAQQKEGFVIVALMALSTVIMMMVVGMCWMVGSKHMQLHSEPVRAEVETIETGETQEEENAKAVLSVG